MKHKINIDFDFHDFWGEHWITILTVALIAVGAWQWVSGGSQLFAKKTAENASREQNEEMQREAERVYSEYGCSAQFLNAATHTTGLTEGAIAVDPSTSTPYNSGYLCSNDGSVFQVQPGGYVHLIGSSPKIRNALVQAGFQDHSIEMANRAKQMGLLTGGNK